ncbi:MAG TPA: GerAB/ArcD/ProY family transporter, partial [Bacilli bacterium]|nr:GerAB/ArcD/ProY family transporter [Bacilli bacterium]
MGNPKPKQSSAPTNKYFLTGSQAASLIASTIIGVGVLTLPRTTTQVAHQFGWMSVLLAAGLSVIAVTIISLLGRRFPERSLVE